MNEIYQRPFNTKEELLKTFGYGIINKEDRAKIKQMDEKKFKELLEDATMLDCFDVGFFVWLINH